MANAGPERSDPKPLHACATETKQGFHVDNNIEKNRATESTLRSPSPMHLKLGKCWLLAARNDFNAVSVVLAKCKPIA